MAPGKKPASIAVVGYEEQVFFDVRAAGDVLLLLLLSLSLSEMDFEPVLTGTMVGSEASVLEAEVVKVTDPVDVAPAVDVDIVVD